MKRKMRNVAREIIADLKEMRAKLGAGIPLCEKYTLRTVRITRIPADTTLRRFAPLVGWSASVNRFSPPCSACLPHWSDRGNMASASPPRSLADCST